jgi:hypothetical protein
MFWPSCGHQRISASALCSPWLSALASIKTMARGVMAGAKGKTSAACCSSTFSGRPGVSGCTCPAAGPQVRTADGGQLQRGQAVLPAGGLALAVQVSDQHVGIDQPAQGAVGEPPRLYRGLRRGPLRAARAVLSSRSRQLPKAGSSVAMASLQTGGASRATRTVTLTPSCPQSSHRGTQSRGDKPQFRKLTQ